MIQGLSQLPGRQGRRLSATGHGAFAPSQRVLYRRERITVRVVSKPKGNVPLDLISPSVLIHANPVIFIIIYYLKPSDTERG